MAGIRRAEDTKGIDPFAVALVLAAALHMALLGPAPGAAASSFAPDTADIEVDLMDFRPPAEAENATELESGSSSAFSATPRPAAPAPPSAALQVAPDGVPVALDPVAEELGPAPQASPPSAAPGTRRPVRLFLGAGDLDALVGGPKSGERGPASAAALFSEGAESGASASSPAVSASYRAARLGPRVGTAVFEVRTNAQGSVVAVYLVSDDETGAWANVVSDLLARLQQSILRVPDGAKGIITRLRVDRGYLAEDLSARGKAPRGAALGQDHHPRDSGWDESTQSSTRPGRLAPTAGVSSDQLRSSVPTRVVLLSQQFL